MSKLARISIEIYDTWSLAVNRDSYRPAGVPLSETDYRRLRHFMMGLAQEEQLAAILEYMKTKEDSKGADD